MDSGCEAPSETSGGLKKISRDELTSSFLRRDPETFLLCSTAHGTAEFLFMLTISFLKPLFGSVSSLLSFKFCLQSSRLTTCRRDPSGSELESKNSPVMFCNFAICFCAHQLQFSLREHQTGVELFGKLLSLHAFVSLQSTQVVRICAKVTPTDSLVSTEAVFSLWFRIFSVWFFQALSTILASSCVRLRSVTRI